MLSSLVFFRKLKRLAKSMPSNIGPTHFMHDEKKRRRQHRDYQPYFSTTVEYRGRWIACEILCDPKGDGKGKFFCRVLPNKSASSTNTQHVTLTNKNVSTDGIYHVTPRLDKCGGLMRKVARKINGYPVKDPIKHRKFHVGPLGHQLLARVFEVAIAKYDSISARPIAVANRRLAGRSWLFEKTSI